jgi:hypothetical protein
MAKRASFPTRAKKAGRKVRRASSGTFIQRSRSESSEQKAIWHQVTGAGRSRVRRQFFGLTDDEQGKVKDVLERQLEARLKTISTTGGQAGPR